MSGLTKGRSVTSPVKILARVLVIPMMEMRKAALTEVTPCSSVSAGFSRGEFSSSSALASVDV